jgi:ribonucleotide reductase alpha subunit
MRNATVTTIAPTGTISIIAGTTSGIEPLFAVCYIRRVMEGTELVEVNPLFEEIARERGFYSEELMQEIAQSGIVSSNRAVPDDIRRLFVCSHDISYAEHVRMQVAFQKHTDNAVSKTINFRESATVEEVREAYLSAWRDGLKGITVYRDNSRPRQVLNIASTRKSGSGVRRGECCDSPEDETSTETCRLEDDSTAPAHTGGAQSFGVRAAATSPQLKRYLSKYSSLKFVSLMESSQESQLFNKSNDRQKAMSSISDCPECGYGSGFVARQESCSLCFSCGYTMC